MVSRTHKIIILKYILLMGRPVAWARSRYLRAKPRKDELFWFQQIRTPNTNIIPFEFRRKPEQSQSQRHPCSRSCSLCGSWRYIERSIIAQNKWFFPFSLHEHQRRITGYSVLKHQFHWPMSENLYQFWSKLVMINA